MWLLPGCHVDPGEGPRQSLEREMLKKLGITAKSHDRFGEQSCFVSVAETRGPGAHTDVTLWFVLEGSTADGIRPDPGEFRGYKLLPGM